MKRLFFLCALLASPVLAGTPLPGGVVVREEREYLATVPGMDFRAGWSATIERDGKRAVLSSAEGTPGVGGAIQFPEAGVELLLRLDYEPGSRTLTAQAGVRNTGATALSLVETCPVSAEMKLDGGAGDWLVTGLHPHTPVLVSLKNTQESIKVHEYGGFYRQDSKGFFFGPAGTPIAYLNTQFATADTGKVAMNIAADMSGVRVDSSETRWGQEVAFVLQRPDQAVSRWVGMVAASHGARTRFGALTGWNNGNPLTKSGIEQEVHAVTEAVRGSEGRLRLGVIQIEQVEGDPGNLRTLDAPWLPDAARQVASVGARFGIRLDTGDLAAMLANVRRAKEVGFNYLKIARPAAAVARGPKQTTFEAMRAEFEAIRKAVGDDTYLGFGGDAPDRAVVGLVDASRIARPALRSDLRGVMDEAILSLPLCGRWFAADFDDVYLGTRTQFGAPPKNESRVEGGWWMVRAWLSLAGLAGGAVLTSDPVYAPDFRHQWTNLDAITPPLNRPMEVPRLFTHAARSCLVTHVERPWGRWTLALLRNAREGPEFVNLDFAGLGLDPKASYAVWGYWDNRLLGVFQGTWSTHYLQRPEIQFVRLTELVPRLNLPTLVGSRLHISCGGEEISSIDASRAGMTIRLTGAGAAGGDLFIHSRFPPVVKEARGCTVEAIALVAENIWRVRIAGRDLRSPQAITLAFLLPLTAQPWFWISIVSVAASLMFALWRYIVSLHARRDQGLAEERARIAQDLHDDLGASLAQLAYHGDALLDAHGLDPAGAGHAEKMREIARGTSRSLDEIVWAVDPKQDTLESFAGYLSSLAQELLSEAGVRCRFDFPDTLHDRPLSSRHRHHIFLATKETLLNIIRHARATEARIRLVIGDKECRLEIEDDGRGFDPSAAPGRPGGGHGLASLRKRMEIVGGRCEMESRPGAGTSIRFIWKTEL